MSDARLAGLPQVGALMDSAAAADLAAHHPRALVKEAARRAVDEARQALLDGSLAEAPSPEALVARMSAMLDGDLAPQLRPVINATGVVVHTGLGRAPLPAEALEAVARTASGYCNLEVRLADGRRGHRYELVEDLLCMLTGAEAAEVVNNNAAAVMLALRALAAGRKVLVSRGQLIEIGGAFRLPEIMAESGCRLVEVGTTNRTRVSDYERVIDEETAAILVVHHSNYRIVGFHEEPPVADLAGLARRSRLLLLHDLGSGALIDLAAHGLAHEPTVPESLAAGADVVCFSGDKLLGGPQVGILAGRRDPVDALRRHPMARALRVDKMCLAALEATLRLYLDEDHVAERVPVLAAITASLPSIRERAGRAYEALMALAPHGVMVKIDDEAARVGGGAMPEYDLPSVVVKIWPQEGLAPDEIARRLRTGRTAVFPRVADGALVLDMRTVREGDVGALVEAVAAALHG
jgi:L-seryl-tRNA(Ser) seleniumtransferase